MENQDNTIYGTFDRGLYRIGVPVYQNNSGQSISASGMNVGDSGGSIDPGEITSGGASEITQQYVGAIASGKTQFTNTETGWILGVDKGIPKFYIGNATNYVNWDGSSLLVSGNITATTGTIGGWTIGTTTLTGGSATLDSAGILTLGTANNVVVLSAADATYRLWIGNATAASAPFSVTKTGVVLASNITATGTINATGGYIGTTTALVFESQGINTGTTGYIRGGQTDFNTGTGYFLGYSSGAYKLSIGDGGVSKFIYWDGSVLNINGAVFNNVGTYAVGADENVKSWYTVQVQAPFTGNASGESFWTVDDTTTQYANGAGWNSAANQGGNSILWSLLGGSNLQLAFASTTNLRLKWVADMAPGTDVSGGANQRTGWTGFTATASAAGQINGDITVVTSRVGFGFYNGLVYAIAANGATITATSLGSYSANASHLYEVILTGTTSAAFYIDGVLKTTISTNLPSTGNLFLDFGWRNTVGTVFRNFVSNFALSQSL